MKRTLPFSVLLLVTVALSLLAARQQPASAKIHCQPLSDTTCLVKHENTYEFPDSLRKKINALIEDQVAGGIEEKGVVTWENSPDAPEYYQIVLRKNKVTIKYKGTICEDKMIAENIDKCTAELKKLLNK
ncbi:hypothetical protein [Chitinophaga qingshengii]|uniref:Uncharacterized protein n=1 Tax=Chitinophaga qingshengii TaxID=1569794 RepID=A0ABR7TWH8_9BACT|nr:hypothetical protein [Chitinophaga qingshengii]MBC9934834.1 hypothetical protein [Chitinophaga qingshengii]